MHNLPRPLLPGRHCSLSFPLCNVCTPTGRRRGCAQHCRTQVKTTGHKNSTHTRASTQQLGRLLMESQSWDYQRANSTSQAKFHRLFTLLGDTPFHRRKKKEYLSSVNIHGISSFMEMSKHGFCETLLCGINQFFLCLKLHLHKADGISVKMVTFLQHKHTPSQPQPLDYF